MGQRHPRAPAIGAERTRRIGADKFKELQIHRVHLLSAPSLPDIAVRRTASLPLAYGRSKNGVASARLCPAIHLQKDHALVKATHDKADLRCVSTITPPPRSVPHRRLWPSSPCNTPAG